MSKNQYILYQYMSKNQYILYQYIDKNGQFISTFCSTFAKSVQEVHWSTLKYEWPPWLIYLKWIKIGPTVKHESNPVKSVIMTSSWSCQYHQKLVEDILLLSLVLFTLSFFTLKNWRRHSDPILVIVTYTKV